MTVDLVRIEPSHAEDLARLHAKAFPDFFLSRLGVPFLTQFYLGFAADPTAVTSIAIRENTIVAAAVGTTSPSGFYKRLLMRQWPGFTTASFRAALNQPSSIPRLFRAVRYRGQAPGAPSGALLSSICVHPALRENGMGTTLLKSWEARALIAGKDLAYLTTDAERNEAVNRFYVRNGWALSNSYLTPEGRRLNLYTRNLQPVEP